VLTPSLDELPPSGKLDGLIPVYRKFNADTLTPVSAYLNLTDGASKPGFLLESVEKGDQLARYSFVGVEPRGTIEVKNGQVNMPNFLTPVETADPYEVVDTITEKWNYRADDALPAFTGGLVGYFGYETVHQIEPSVPVKPPTEEISFPDCLLYYVESMVIFDHVERSVYLVGHLDTRAEKAIEQQYVEIEKRLKRWREMLTKAPVAPPVKEPDQPVSERVRSNFKKEQYLEAVRTVQDHIRTGDAFQVVISQRFELEDPNHPFNIYRRLRSLNPSPYMIYFDFEDFQLVGASPEMLVQKEGSTVRTRPIAGTRRRGADPVEDQALARELQNDTKEQAEHTMLVDLGRNDLGRISKPGTVRVNERAVVERYSHVMHLVSDVVGEIKDDCTAVDALRATFPAGTVSGAPKVRAMQIIDGCEPDRRGPYSGAAGFFGFNGDLNTCIIIRTLINQGDKVYVQAGGGIVDDSRPGREFEETREKARALLRALETLPDTDFI